MADSILDSMKKALGIDLAYDVFDRDLIMHINSVFGTLSQIGAGPPNGYRIVDKANNWEEFIGTATDMDFVKDFMYIKLRLLFDPPQTSFALTSFDKQLEELTVRINIAAKPFTAVPEGSTY